MAKKESLLLFFIGIILFFVFDLERSFFYKIQGIHEWRQADCLGLTYNYYINGLNFFDISFLCVNTATCHGKVVGEFPILYYFTAILWKVFGQHEIILRLLNFSIFLIGLVYLNKLSKKFFPQGWLSFIPVLSIIGSPVIVYYCNNYIPDIPALGLVIIGFYYYFEFLNEPEKNKLIKTSVFWTFAMLLKITAGILPLAAMIVLVLYSIKNKQLILVLKQSIPMVFCFLIVASWYYYANTTNEKNQSHHFLLTGILPIWNVPKEIFSLKTEVIFSRTITQLFPNAINILFIVLFFFLIVNYKRVSKPLLYITLFSFIGTVGYFILWYNQFEAHDYYFINFIPFYICLFLLFGSYYSSLEKKVFSKNIIIGLWGSIIIFNIYNSAVNIRLRYYHDDFILKSSFTKVHELELYEYLEKLHRVYIKPFETCKPYLKQIGLDESKKVIILPDYTYNMTLYYSGLRGFTSCGRSGVDGYTYIHDDGAINSQINCGAKYLFIYDDRLLQVEGLKKYLTHPIGKYQNIIIYELVK